MTAEDHAVLATEHDGARSGSPTRRFIRHYFEMLAAMFLGMLVLGMPAEMIIDSDGAAVTLISMAVTMTVPMVGWMRYRRHSWQRCFEMAAAMLVPALGTLALLAADLVTDADTLLVIEHVVMFPAMLAVMLYRRGEYSGHHDHGA